MNAPRLSFLVVGGFFGLFFAFATPPHDPPDEARHHARVWLISQGRLGVVGRAPGHDASVPRDIVRLHPPSHHYSDEQLSSGRLPPNTQRTSPHEWSARLADLRGSLGRWDLQPIRYASSYMPAVYAPYVPALWLAGALELSAAAGLLLARLFGLAAWLAGIAMALRIAPSRRWLLCSAALLPVSVFQGASVSGDPLTQVAIFWWFAECLRAAERGADTLAPADLARLGLAALALGLVKPGYAPLALASLMLPLRAAPRLALAAGALALAGLPTLWWASVVAAADLPPLFPGADPVAQLRHMAAHPIAFLLAAAAAIQALLPAWLDGLVGNLGHFDVEIPVAATALGLSAVVASATLGHGRLPRGGAGFLLAAFAATLLTVLAMAYLGWSAVGSHTIQGVQGRYFLPLLPFALAGLPRAPAGAQRPLAGAVVAALVAVLTVSAVQMLRAYYVL
jgi:Predicted membrane protein (DUF2142)